MLSTIGLETDTSVRYIDPTFARLFDNGDAFVREEIASALAPLLIQHPERFPEVRSALRESLTDFSPDVQLTAARTLAVLSHDAPNTIDDVGGLLTTIEGLRDETLLPKAAVEEAVTIVRTAANEEGNA